ncbi:MAG: FtsW/RodA/SpoVE family cell cycle protein [Candidatus Symbiothrix sp.]|jgi:cell division protein FtsW|nr:FtsW/RodA/SpoVE family cell cycle protein [Candidatus Symbiothrix sp.]
MDFFGKIFRGDRVVWIIFIILCLISIVEVYSASARLTYAVHYWQPILKHSIGILIGLAVALAIHAIPPRFFSAIGGAIPIVWGLLLYACIIHSRSVFGIHPIELAKISLIVLAAFLFSQRTGKNVNTIFWWVIGITAITCVPVAKLNGSSALLLCGVIYIMLFIAQMPWKKMLGLTAVLLAFGIIAGSLLWNLSKDTLNGHFISETLGLTRADIWQDRLKNFFSEDEKDNVNSPNFNIHSDNEQANLAQIAIANGGWIRFAPGKSIERDFLPDSVSDFIYAIIIEEFGLAGGFFVLLLYIILFIRAGIIANRTDKPFLKLIVLGSSIMMMVQALVHIGSCVQSIPVTGQTLPLISKGSTSILVVCAYFGMILSVSRYENPRGVKQEENIDAEMIAASEELNNETNHEEAI